MNPQATIRPLARALAGCLLAASGAVASAAEPADLVFRNAEVLAPGGTAQALAVRDGVITVVGTAAEVQSQTGPRTTVLDLGGATVLPGLHDTHVHSMFAGLEQFQCRFAYGANPAEIVAAVKQCAAKLKPGEWLVGGNWVGAVFTEVEQHRRLLDEAAPHNPVVLGDEAHHSVWVNTRALELAGITRETANPPGGIIERDAAGEANGLLREEATRLVESIVPPPDAATRSKALLLSSRQMLSFGITSYTEASVRKGDIATFAALSEEGALKQRVRGCIVWMPGDADGERLILDRAFHARPRFATDCVKIFTDGVPLESRTAAMLEPYLDDHGGQDGHGMLMVPQQQLNEAVARFDRAGLHVKFHAAGDAAVRAALDAVAFARKANGGGGPVHDVGHNSFIDPADLPRARELHVAHEFSPYIWYPTPIVAVDVRRVVGEERLARFTPVRDGLESGALVTAGSDWSVVPSVNPWLAIETLVTRQAPGGSAETIAPGQRISLAQALTLFTENGARLMGQRDRVGAIEPGMRADLVVTEKNPFEVPVTAVHQTRVRMTFIDGEKVYDATSP
jgi:hypothetical protein